MSLSGLKDKLNTGIDSLDCEHRRLVGVMEEICDSYDRDESAVSDLFGTLYAEISTHFALEESTMREKKYAFYDAHKADHEQLLDRIRFMMDAYEDGLCKDCGTTLRACLEAWFADHMEPLCCPPAALDRSPATLRGPLLSPGRTWRRRRGHFSGQLAASARTL